MPGRRKSLERLLRGFRDAVSHPASVFPATQSLTHRPGTAGLSRALGSPGTDPWSGRSPPLFRTPGAHPVPARAMGRMIRGVERRGINRGEEKLQILNRGLFLQANFLRGQGGAANFIPLEQTCGIIPHPLRSGSPVAFRWSGMDPRVKPTGVRLNFVDLVHDIDSTRFQTFRGV